MLPYRVRKEAEEVGCYGLVDGFARNINTYQIYSAETCTSMDGPFFCTSCLSDVVVRKCTEKRDHFAHIARTSQTGGKAEGELHKKCKTEMCEALAALNPAGKWEVERTIKEHKAKGTPELRPDISGYIDGKLVAIEVQASVLSISKILSKMEAYTKWNINTLWIVPLAEPLGELPFRPRLYERYLHSMYYGRIYYWAIDHGIELDTVHLGVAGRNLEYNEWCEEGDLRTAGGYFKPYKIIKTPIYGARINISNHFGSHLRPEFVPDNTRKIVPKCLLWKDRLPIWWNADDESKYTEAYFKEIFSDLRLPVQHHTKLIHRNLTKAYIHPFHSILEAQWAVFFDAMGIKYEYEKEVFQFEEHIFIPDFWLPQVSMWADVKPNRFTDVETLKCQKVANKTGKRCLLLEGAPDFRSYWGIASENEDDDYCDWDTDYLLTSEYLHSESRFYCSTGASREKPFTDKDMFGSDYITAVKEADNLIK